MGARQNPEAPAALAAISARRIACAVVAAVLFGCAPGAMAQAQHDPSVTDQVRTIPADTKLGRLRMGVFPEAVINRQPVRFSPGARIFDRNNIVTIPSTLTDPVAVLYRVDTLGQISAAWVLTDDELVAAQRRR